MSYAGLSSTYGMAAADLELNSAMYCRLESFSTTLLRRVDC